MTQSIDIKELEVTLNRKVTEKDLDYLVEALMREGFQSPRHEEVQEMELTLYSALDDIGGRSGWGHDRQVEMLRSIVGDLPGVIRARIEYGLVGNYQEGDVVEIEMGHR